MNNPKVTVLMPAYNAERFIAEAIESVLGQDFKDFELLIINDGSTDQTLSIIRKFPDERIRLLEQPNQGIARSLNRGLQEARGNYIARFDADDICFPNRLRLQAHFLDDHPDHILVGCDAEYITEDGEHLFHFHCIGHTHQEIMQQLQVDCPFIHSGVMYRKEPILLQGGYSSHAHHFEDYLLWIQLAGTGKYHNLPEELIKVRFNPGSATMDEKWRGRRFRRLKKEIIRRGSITEEEGLQLLAVIRGQDRTEKKKGAYFALCGKKFLLNNYQPSKARQHLGKAIGHYPLRLDNYALYMLSFFPRPFINWLHRKSD